jgi:hypothetical protein
MCGAVYDISFGFFLSRLLDVYLIHTMREYLAEACLSKIAKPQSL